MSSLFLYLILLILWGPPIFIHLIVQYFSYTELKCIHGGGGIMSYGFAQARMAWHLYPIHRHMRVYIILSSDLTSSPNIVIRPLKVKSPLLSN